MRNLIPAALFALAFSFGAHAATFTVNSEADVPDDSVGDGECHAVLGLPGVCTLRAAVQEANANPGTDTISLSAGQTYTLTRSGQDDTALNGDLDITDNVTILFFATGERPVVDAGGLERAFEIHSGNVTLFGFDITGGDATLSLDRSGGAVAIDFDAGIVQLSILNVYGNQANFGGGIYNDGPSTTVSACNVYDNTLVDFSADSTGSGILNRGTMQLDHSAVFGNHGEGELSAVAVANVPPNTGVPSLDVVDSTIAENLGTGIVSGDSDNNDAILRLSNVTVAGNSGIGVHARASDAGSFELRNSVIAKNAASDCQLPDPMFLDLDLNHYNADSDESCALAGDPGNNPGIEPLLTPIARRGPLTWSSWPLTTSPLIDLGPITGCEADDQYFVDRSIDFDGSGVANCDTGAIEMTTDVIFFDPFERL